MPKLFMLIGIPGSGKSTWIKNQKHNAVIVSTDDIIEREAARQNKTYSDVFDQTIKKATQEMQQDLRQAIAQQQDIIWDQTNLTAKSRASKLRQIPNTYEKIAVFFPTPDREELTKRLDSRAGKTIPTYVIKSMADNLETPSPAEGFDQVIFV